MTKRHENLWLQGKELDERVLKYWADPPNPLPSFPEDLALSWQTQETHSSQKVAIFLDVPSEGDHSFKK